MVSTHLKNIGQIGNLSQIEVKIKNIWNHHPDNSSVVEVPPQISKYEKNIKQSSPPLTLIPKVRAMILLKPAPVV